MGAPVDPMHFTNGGDNWDEDEDIVYSRDPLATGLLIYSDTASSSGDGGGDDIDMPSIAGPSNFEKGV